MAPKILAGAMSLFYRILGSPSTLECAVLGAEEPVLNITLLQILSLPDK